jgi:N-dimethylarginine dimethylaminohydrolase
LPKLPRPIPRPLRVLMADPEHFDLVYAINPFMTDTSGELKRIDKTKALMQWRKLRETYLSLGIEVETISAAAGFPDFVFCANQSFPFWPVKPENEAKAGPAVIMSQMRSDFRKGEVEHFEKWFKEKGYRVFHLKGENLSFEGNGDALLDPSRPLIWGGHGPRTDREVYREISEITGREVVVLPLKRPEFYHLDTCFSILNEDTVVVQPDAFSIETRSMIAAAFKRVIETDLEECRDFFTANCHSPDGKNIILNQGAPRFEEKLRRADFRVHAIDTSEFLKAGGSVFCMKLMYF